MFLLRYSFQGFHLIHSECECQSCRCKPEEACYPLTDLFHGHLLQVGLLQQTLHRLLQLLVSRRLLHHLDERLVVVRAVLCCRYKQRRTWRSERCCSKKTSRVIHLKLNRNTVTANSEIQHSCCSSSLKHNL